MPDGLEDQAQAQRQSVAPQINIQRQNSGNPVAPVNPAAVPQAQVQRQATNAEIWSTAHSTLLTNMQGNVQLTDREWETRAEAASRSAEGIIREFNTKGSVGWFSRRSRKKAFKAKMELSRESKALKDNEPDPPAQNGLSLRFISEMMDDDTDYLDFKDDKDFIKKFNVNFPKILRFSGIDMNDLDPYLEINESMLDEAGIHYSVQEIKSRAKKFAKAESYYRAKRDMIASPFYSVLTSDDTKKIGDDQFRNLSSDQSPISSPALKEYFKNLSTLRDLESDGVLRTGRDKLQVSGYKKTSGKKNGTRGYFSVGNASVGIKTTLKGGVAEGRGYNDYDRNEENMADHKELNKIDLLNAKVEASAEANILEAGFKGEKRNKYGKGNWEGNVQVGQIKTYASIGGGLSLKTKDNSMPGWVGGEVGAEGSVVKGKLGASYTSHNDKHGVYGEAEGRALYGNANAVAKYGTFKIPGGLEIENGVAVTAGWEVGLAKGSVSGGFKIFGIKIGATLSGSAGSLGASFGAYASKGKVGFGFGLAALLGFKLDINIDFSYWTNKLKSKFVKKVMGKKS